MILPACVFQYSLDWHLPSAHYLRLQYSATASVTDAHFCGGTVAGKFCTNIHSTEACHLQALEAAPLLATTCLQTRLKPRAMLDATCCALLDLSSFFTLNVYTNFPGTTRRARRSACERAIPEGPQWAISKAGWGHAPQRKCPEGQHNQKKRCSFGLLLWLACVLLVMLPTTEMFYRCLCVELTCRSERAD